MKYFMEIKYEIYDNEVLYKSMTIGVAKDRAITGTAILNFIKRRLDAGKKKFTVKIITREPISEEQAIGRDGNKLINLNNHRYKI